MLSDRREHLKDIYKRLEEIVPTGYYVGGMKEILKRLQ